MGAQARLVGKRVCLLHLLHSVNKFQTMKCVLGNVLFVFRCITVECVRVRETDVSECQRKQLSPALHYTQSSVYVSDKFAEGVGMWFGWYFQMQNRSPFFSVWLSLFSNRMKIPAFKTYCQKLGWQNI